MKTGDIVMIYTDPIECTLDEGMAKLIEKIKSENCIELWSVEFLDLPGFIFERFLQNKKYGTIKQKI